MLHCPGHGQITWPLLAATGNVLYLAAVHFLPSSPSNCKHLIKCNFIAGQYLQRTKWLCEIPMRIIAWLFRQAEHKCEDFLIFLSFHKSMNFQTTLPISSSMVIQSPKCTNLFAKLRQQTGRPSSAASRREDMCAWDRGKSDKTRRSLANNLPKCWNRINFLLNPYILQEGSLPSITWCAGPCCLHASWGPLLRQKNLGENEN